LLCAASNASCSGVKLFTPTGTPLCCVIAAVEFALAIALALSANSCCACASTSH